MRTAWTAPLVCLLILTMVAVAALPAIGDPSTGSTTGAGPTAGGDVIAEVGDETHNWRDARPLATGETYQGHLSRVGDRSDHFTVTAAQLQEVNVHVYVMGHDGVNEWLRPPTTTPPSPPAPVRASTMLDCFIYKDPVDRYPLDGAYNYYYVRHYMLNIVAPVPGTHTYHVNVSINWAWTPNNYTWDYALALEVGPVPSIEAGEPVTGTLDMAGRDARWYRVDAPAGHEVNGSFEILNFETGDPESRNIDVWVFPDDLGGYPRSLSWDWSAAPNEPVEPFSILATYSGSYYIKLRGMNHEDVLPCSYRLEVHVQEVPTFPDTGVQNAYFDRYWHDTDWYSFEMEAGQAHPTKPGLWNEMQYFNMTERADSDDLPDFDLYLFGLTPGSRQLDLLDSSFRNDHASFQDPDRDPNRNTEHVSAAAFYSGTYYIEVNAWNNTGLYDLRREHKSPVLSDDNDLPGKAEPIKPGKHQGYVHQSKDHYDWYSVQAEESIWVQFDSYKVYDMFNLSIYRQVDGEDGYRLLAGGWNVRFNITTREDQVTNAVTVAVDLASMGLGAGTYHIVVFAAVATGIGTDPVSGRPFVYVTDGEAEANYELRVRLDGVLDQGIRTVPIPDDVVEEDTDLLDHLDLGHHFTPTDPEVELTYKHRLVRGRGQIILQGDSLGFHAAPDYAGPVQVVVTAYTPSMVGRSLTWNITFTPVNDAPRTRVAEPPLVFVLPEDSVRTLDLGAYVKDVDDGDAITMSAGSPEHLDLGTEEGSSVITVTGHQDWVGEETVVFTFTDPAGARLDFPVRFVVENVDDAPVALQDLGTQTITEDTVLVLDLAEYFADPDGDVLSVSVSSDPFVGSEHDTVTGLLTLAPLPDWYGGRLLWVTVTDPSGRSLQASLWLQVEPVPDPPVIASWSPVADLVGVLEAGELTLAVLDVDDPDSSVLFYRWYLDGVFVGPSMAINYRPGLGDQGAHEVTVVVEDEEGLTDSFTWTVEVEDVPQAPDGGIATPPDGSRFREGEPVPFVAFFYDPDGGMITYAWFIDGRPVSEEATFEKELDAGDHRVTLQVSSDGDQVTEELDLRVLEAEGGASSTVVIAVVVIALIAVTGLVLLLRRRRV